MIRASIFLRSFSSLVPRGSGVTGHPPLDKPFPGVITTKSHDIQTALSKATQITKLLNGMRVASSPITGGMSSIGVILDSGPRCVFIVNSLTRGEPVYLYIEILQGRDGSQIWSITFFGKTQFWEYIKVRIS